MKIIEPDRLRAYLAEARDVNEIAKEFGINNLLEITAKSMNPPAGFTIFNHRDHNLDMPLFRVAPTPPWVLPGAKPRVWSYLIPHQDQPSIWIQFPHDIKHKKIKIVGLSDVHYGAKAHNKERFLAYLKWIADNDNVFCFLNGDLIENALPTSKGSAIFESILYPDEQLWGCARLNEPGIIELLRPIAHKILWGIPGNHEWRTWYATRIDPTRIICRELGIPYFSEPVYADILVFGRCFTFFSQHGATGAATKGGKLNAAGKPGEFQEAVDFLFMGHVHDSMMNATERIIRRRVYNEHGKIIQRWLETRSQHIVIFPSFYGYFETYASRANYAPGSWGAVSATLFADGSCRASE